MIWSRLVHGTVSLKPLVSCGDCGVARIAHKILDSGVNSIIGGATPRMGTKSTDLAIYVPDSVLRGTEYFFFLTQMK